MEKSKDNPGHVTHAQCAQISGDIKSDMETVKIALVGKDLQGGIVKKMNDLTNGQKKNKELIQQVVDNNNKKQKQKQELSRFWKITIGGALASSIGTLIVAVLCAYFGI